MLTSLIAVVVVVLYIFIIIFFFVPASCYVCCNFCADDVRARLKTFVFVISALTLYFAFVFDFAASVCFNKHAVSF